MKHTLFVLILLIGGLAGLNYAVSKRSDCFSPDFVAYPIEKVPNPLPFEPPSNEVRQILEQKFTFLGSGNQSFAFESEDQQWVLKLIKFRPLIGFDPYDLLPSSLTIKHQKSKEDRLERIFQGFNVAYTHDRQNCGLKYLHNSHTDWLPAQTLMVDKAGRKHFLDLNNYIFALQAKAVPLGAFLRTLLSDGKIAEAKNILNELFTMYKHEFKQGLYDADHNVMHNIGIAEGKIIRIDFGKLTLKREMQNDNNAQIELEKIEKERITPWLERLEGHFFK